MLDPGNSSHSVYSARSRLADEFNPYGQWLGLADARSPSHYELLSLAAFEADPQKIAAAAERATTKVRSFRPGPHARAWSQLLDQIRDAKECLSDPARKTGYDDDLRRGQANVTVAPQRASASPSPAAVFAPVQSEFYPPGMAPPASVSQGATRSTEASAAMTPRPRSDLDPPLRGAPATSAASATPMAAEILPDDSLPVATP